MRHFCCEWYLPTKIMAQQNLAWIQVISLYALEARQWLLALPVYFFCDVCIGLFDGIYLLYKECLLPNIEDSISLSSLSSDYYNVAHSMCRWLLAYLSE